MLFQFKRQIKSFLGIVFFLCLPLLYSEEVAEVNQVHSSSYTFEMDESIPTSNTDPVKSVLISEETHIQPGKPFWLAVRLNLEDQWHLYWKNPGDSGMPVSIDWHLPEGFKAENFEWPYPHRFDASSFIGFGYEKETYFLTQIIPPHDIKEGDYSFKAEIKYLVCSDSACLPGQSEIELALPVKNIQLTKDVAQAESFAAARSLIPVKSWESTAKRLNQLIELTVKSPDENDEKLVHAYFCPEVGQSIDYHVETIVSNKPNEKGVYTVALKEDPSIKSSLLKGVLVLETKQGDQTEKRAIEINGPIFNSSQDIILAENTPLKKPLDIDLANQLPESEFEGGLGFALLLAFAGGMILNLMPCVLPVISFKILSFVKMSGQSRSLTFKHGIAFCVGVMISFWTLAIVLISMQAYGHAVGWGFQLQEPIFVASLAALLFIFSLSMFGLFEMGAKVGAAAGQMNHQKQEGFTGSFLSGILATLIATPCTGPFLGTVVGLAMTLPYYFSLLIFTAMGFGMAFPYLILSAYPQLMRFLPKPGNWMIVFKQLMGFLMLASVLWLVWVFSAQTGTTALIILLIAFFIMSLACWIYGQWGTPVHSKRSRAISTTLAVLLISMGFYAVAVASFESVDIAQVESKATNENIVWEDFSPQRLEQLRAEGTPVFIDFTAKWCLICQTNHAVLSVGDVDQKFNEIGVVRMKADWTKKDPVITEELKKFGRNSVPLYVLYEGDQKPKILPQVLTPGVVMDHLTDVENTIAEREKKHATSSTPN